MEGACECEVLTLPLLGLASTALNQDMRDRMESLPVWREVPEEQVRCLCALCRVFQVPLAVLMATTPPHLCI